MDVISLEEMLKSGVHFGHQKRRRHPKMASYIFGVRAGINIIDLEQTAVLLEKALEYVQAVVAKGGTILFVATKRQAQTVTRQVAEAAAMPWVTERWLGGTLTNFDNIGKLTRRLKDLRSQQEKGELSKYTKREQQKFAEEIEYLEKLVGGIQNMEKMPDALFIIDTKKEKTALREARKKHIPVIAMVDTNVNPELITYPIPANDDASKSINLIVKAIGQAVEEGRRQQSLVSPVTKEENNINKRKE